MPAMNNQQDNRTMNRLEKLRSIMQEKGLEATVLSQSHHIAAFFDGAQSFLGTRPEAKARVAIIVTSSHLHVLGNKTECTRVCEEELLNFPGVVPHAAPWHDWKIEEAIDQFLQQQGISKWWGDAFGPGVAECRENIESLLYPLEEKEFRRLQELGALVSSIMVETAQALRPGILEQEVAGWIHERLLKAGALPDMIFIAFDARISRFRHCQPGSARLERTAFISITASLKGLYISATRLAAIPPVPPRLMSEVRIANEIEAAAIQETRPGVALGHIFDKIQAIYKKHGHPNGWQEHHLGGPSGFRGRDVKVAPGHPYIIKAGQPYVYNPVFGTGKSEDTFIRYPGPDQLICLTADNHWPLYQVEIPGYPPIGRPGILII